MEIAWCCTCCSDVSVAHVIAELPCPSCGGKQYFCVMTELDRDTCDAEATRMMRIGLWEAAGCVYQDAARTGILSAAENNLRMAQLEWRKDCAMAAVALASADGGIPLPRLRSALLVDYDEYVVKWVLREFRGICLEKHGAGYLVKERLDG